MSNGDPNEAKPWHWKAKLAAAKAERGQIEDEACGWAFELGRNEAERFAVEHDRLLELGEHLRAASDEALRRELARRSAKIRSDDLNFKREPTTTPAQIFQLAANLADLGGRPPWQMSLPPREFEMLSENLAGMAPWGPAHEIQPHTDRLAMQTPSGQVDVLAHLLAPTGGVMISTQPPFDYGPLYAALDRQQAADVDPGRESEAETDRGEP